MKTLVRISIPERLRNEMMMKEANFFDVPATLDGHAFMRWWEEAPADDRDEVLKIAYEKDTNVVKALREKLESES
jgi:hypothetical protein